MNKLNSLQQDRYIATSAPLPRRLFVLVAGAEEDRVDLTSQIWEIAKSQGLEVMLLALCNNFDQEAQLRRRLISMAAIIRDDTVRVDIQIKYGNNWLKMAKKEWRPGDVLVCTSDQYIDLRRRLLSEALSSNFKTPVQVLSTVHLSKRPISKILSNTIFWLGSFCILSLFFGVEAMLAQIGQDWLHTFVLSLCVFFEIGFLWIWNFLF